MTQVRRIKLLGFNTIRLPFSMSDLMNGTARDYQWASCPNIAQSDVMSSVTNPSMSLPNGGCLLLQC